MNLTIIRLNEARLLVPINPQYFLWQLDRGRFLSCNASVAKKFKHAHPNISAAKPVISDEQFLELTYLRDFMHQFRLDLFLFGGTLLGIAVLVCGF